MNPFASVISSNMFLLEVKITFSAIRKRLQLEWCINGPVGKTDWIVEKMTELSSLLPFSSPLQFAVFQRGGGAKCLVEREI